MTTENKYKRAAEVLRRDHDRLHDEHNAPAHDHRGSITLLDLAAALPEGEAERVLKAAARGRLVSNQSLASLRVANKQVVKYMKAGMHFEALHLLLELEVSE